MRRNLRMYRGRQLTNVITVTFQTKSCVWMKSASEKKTLYYPNEFEMRFFERAWVNDGIPKPEFDAILSGSPNC